MPNFIELVNIIIPIIKIYSIGINLDVFVISKKFCYFYRDYRCNKS